MFADIDPESFNLHPDAVEAAITPRTKVLFLGYPCNPTGAVLDLAVSEEAITPRQTMSAFRAAAEATKA